jgi:hypothetical protein
LLFIAYIKICLEVIFSDCCTKSLREEFEADSEKSA